MKTPIAKKWDDHAKDYADMAADRQADAYEYEINFPSIMSLLPGGVESVLDVGTGSGDFIPELKPKFTSIAGTDVSPRMVEIAKQNYPDHEFYVWDLEEKFDHDQTYDAIVCKLVLMFVEDLDNVAREFHRLLKPNGAAVVSVIHPTYWYSQHLLDKHGVEKRPEFATLTDGYFSTNKGITKLIGGNQNLHMTFTHRTLTDYLSPFLRNGLAVDAIDEPPITEDFLKTSPRFADRLGVPMRLNFRLKKLN